MFLWALQFHRQYKKSCHKIEVRRTEDVRLTLWGQLCNWLDKYWLGNLTTYCEASFASREAGSLPLWGWGQPHTLLLGRSFTPFFEVFYSSKILHIWHSAHVIADCYRSPQEQTERFLCCLLWLVVQWRCPRMVLSCFHVVVFVFVLVIALYLHLYFEANMSKK